MLASLTPAVTRALDAARLFAQARGAAEVAPADLLAGLLEEEDGRAAAAAVAAGLDLAAFLAARGPRHAGPADLPLGDAAERAIYAARELAAERLGDGDVSSELVLLALLRQEAALAAGLEAHGLRLPDLETSLAEHKAPPLPLDAGLDLADLTERADIARALDAGLNRAREALRVIEDYCRFVLADALLCAELKQLRHDLARAADEQAPPGLLEARDTLRDVGTSISTAGERSRASLAEVVAANLKRLQEALRSLEEFAKVPRPLLAELIEQVRYRAYTLEKAVLLGRTARARLAGARLYVLLTGASCAAALDWTIAEAAAGGADVIQLREKSLPDRALIARARDCRRWAHRAGALFVMNDRPDLARLAEADGVHLGQDDLPVAEARRVLGPDALVGVSTHSMEQLRQAVLDGASYVGVGPVFASGTKSFEALAGLDYVRAAAAATTLPAFAIGGIDGGNVGQVVAAGARRIAVSRAVACSDDPRGAAAGLRAALRDGSSK